MALSDKIKDESSSLKREEVHRQGEKTMKLWKFNSVKFTFLMTVMETLMTIYLMSKLSTLVTDDLDTLKKNVLILLGLYLTERGLQYFKLYSQQVSSYYIRRQLNDRVSHHYRSISYSKFKSKTVGERTSMYVNDIPQVVGLLFGKLIDVTYSLALIFFALGALWRISTMVFVISAILTVGMIFVPQLFSKRLSMAISSSQSEKEKFLGKMTELLTGFFVFVSTCSLPKFMSRAQKVSESYAKAVTDVDIFAAEMTAVLNFAGNILTLTVLGLTSYMVVQGQVAVGTLLSVIGIVPLVGDASQLLLTNYTFYKSGKEFYQSRFGEIEEFYSSHLTKPFLRRKKDIGEESILPSSVQIEEIRVENLKILYENKEIAVKDIRFQKGKKYVLTGESGCGKSSLLKVILGEVEDYEGEVLIDGVAKNKGDTLYDTIAYMSQDSFLFKESMAENIKTGNDSAKVEELLERVGMQELGGEYPIEENGKNLSGGQKQRIAFARTLALSKKVLFMDEATANLDANTARMIEGAVLDSDMTVVMITHHLNDEIRQKADEIIDLGGRIA